MMTLTNLPDTGVGQGSVVLCRGEQVIKQEEGFFVNFILIEGKRCNFDSTGDIKNIEKGSFKNGYLSEGAVLYKSGTIETGTFYKKILIKGEVIGLEKKKIDNSFFTKYL